MPLRRAPLALRLTRPFPTALSPDRSPGKTDAEGTGDAKRWTIPEGQHWDVIVEFDHNWRCRNKVSRSDFLYDPFPQVVADLIFTTGIAALQFGYLESDLLVSVRVLYVVQSVVVAQAFAQGEVRFLFGRHG